jgi:hypothetical protein
MVLVLVKPFVQLMVLWSVMAVTKRKFKAVLASLTAYSVFSAALLAQVR